MKSLSPIDVEFYENQFKQLILKLDRAANLLIPDAYEMEKEQLLKAKSLIEGHVGTFNEVLNLCSVGVIFNESYYPKMDSVESNINNSISGILWSCQDIISSILILNSDFSDYLLGLNLYDEMVWSIDQFILTEKKFNTISDALEESSRLIISVLSKLEGYTI